jgi:hypothetical protein
VRGIGSISNGDRLGEINGFMTRPRLPGNKADEVEPSRS